MAIVIKGESTHGNLFMQTLLDITEVQLLPTVFIPLQTKGIKKCSEYLPSSYNAMYFLIMLRDIVAVGQVCDFITLFSLVYVCTIQPILQGRWFISHCPHLPFVTLCRYIIVQTNYHCNCTHTLVTAKSGMLTFFKSSIYFQSIRIIPSKGTLKKFIE